ncbi:glycosyltransferase [Roseateles oligotrophus]|uniref:Glycosyltransferase n=1 Tax=Roseateles oligotrophus TaxID=1769250 RepID=A0ABT2YFP0_9BURK|nr:glycosyltransferase [Roseateles oligotrophus]MCV2368870.1 glycosyltransferase [Roseateles oligotrophus]
MSAAAPLLMVAYQCGPGLGSVSQIGWQWFSGMTERRPTTLVTHVRNRAAIEAAPPLPAQARVIYIDTEWFAGPLYRLAKRLFPRSEHAVFMLSQLDWFLFDALALRRLSLLQGQQAASQAWQLLHLVTPVTVSAPTRLHRLGLPVVRGPLNCGLPVPAGFESLLRDDAMGLSRLRLLPRLLEAVLGSLRHSRAVLVATAATRAALPSRQRSSAINMLENGVDPQAFNCAAVPAHSYRQGNALRICFVGRLVAVKALPLLLRAMARLQVGGTRFELEVVGEGPMRAQWQADAEALGLSGCINWRGALAAPGVAEAMQRCQVFCLPSVRESGGAVLLEAMACGRPVIAMKFGGPAEIVDEQVGWCVPMDDTETAVAGLQAALLEAHAAPELARAKGECGRQRVLARHSWAAKLDAAEAVYSNVLASVTPA